MTSIIGFESSSTVSKFCIFASIFLLAALVFVRVEGKVCPGFCVPQELCESDGGRVLGFCTNHRACCEVRNRWNGSTCGARVGWNSNNKPAHFVSPKYPEFSGGSLICQYEMSLEKNAVGVKLEFDKFELDMQKLYFFNAHYQANNDEDQNTGENSRGKFSETFKCDADLFFIKGFSNWMTDPKCGNLNGYSLLVDVNKSEYPERKIILLFIMSSKKYRWRIKIHQIMAKKLRKSELCLENRMADWEKGPNFIQKLNIINMDASSPSFSTSQLSQSVNTNLNFDLNSNSGSNPNPTQPPWKWQANLLLLLKTNAIIQDTASFKNSQNFFCPKRILQIFEILCSGSIIDDRHILVPSSCFSSSQPALSDLKVEINEQSSCEVSSNNNSNNDDSEGYLLEIESIIMHFNHLETMRLNDIAMIRLKRAINFTKTWSQPLRLFEEYNPPKVQFFSSVPGPVQLPEKLPMALGLPPEAAEDCSLVQTLDLQLSPESVKDLLETSNKFSGLLDNWICFNISSYSYSAQMKGHPLIGSPLMGSSSSSTTGSGENLRLIGIFNHALSFEPTTSNKFLHLPFFPMKSSSSSSDNNNNDLYHKYKYTVNNNNNSSSTTKVFSSSSFPFRNVFRSVLWPLNFHQTHDRGQNSNSIKVKPSSKEKRRSFFYFTNLSLYRRWILMAIS